MKTAFRISVLALLVFTLAAAPKNRAWQTGTLTDSRTVDTGIAPRYPNMIGGGSAAATMNRATAISTTAELLITGTDYSYVVRDAGRNAGLLHHLCRYIVGDDIKYVHNKLVMYLIDADGNECSARVMKQERVPPVAAPAPLKP